MKFQYCTLAVRSLVCSGVLLMSVGHAQSDSHEFARKIAPLFAQPNLLVNKIKMGLNTLLEQPFIVRLDNSSSPFLRVLKKHLVESANRVDELRPFIESPIFTSSLYMAGRVLYTVLNDPELYFNSPIVQKHYPNIAMLVNAIYRNQVVPLRQKLQSMGLSNDVLTSGVENLIQLGLGVDFDLLALSRLVKLFDSAILDDLAEISMSGVKLAYLINQELLMLGSDNNTPVNIRQEIAKFAPYVAQHLLNVINNQEKSKVAIREFLTNVKQALLNYANKQ